MTDWSESSISLTGFCKEVGNFIAYIYPFFRSRNKYTGIVVDSRTNEIVYEIDSEIHSPEKFKDIMADKALIYDLTAKISVSNRTGRYHTVFALTHGKWGHVGFRSLDYHSLDEAMKDNWQFAMGIRVNEAYILEEYEGQLYKVVAWRKPGSTKEFEILPNNGHCNWDYIDRKFRLPNFSLKELNVLSSTTIS